MRVVLRFDIYGVTQEELEERAEGELAKFARSGQDIEYDLDVEAHLRDERDGEVVVWVGHVYATLSERRFIADAGISVGGAKDEPGRRGGRNIDR
jgi:hypothetical protein